MVLLGSTGLNVSRLCFGTGRISPLSNEDGAKLLHEAFRRGVTFWDTADCYGTHRHVKAALKRVPRSKVVIQTKIDAVRASQARELIKRNRDELGTDPDITLLHSVESTSNWKARQSAFKELVKAKHKRKMKAIGFSTHTSPAVVQATVNEPKVQVILASVHPKYIKYGTPAQMFKALENAHHAGKGILTMKLLGAGQDVSGFEARLRTVLKKPFVHAVNLGISTHDQLARDVQLVKR